MAIPSPSTSSMSLHPDVQHMEDPAPEYEIPETACFQVNVTLESQAVDTEHACRRQNITAEASSTSGKGIFKPSLTPAFTEDIVAYAVTTVSTRDDHESLAMPTLSYAYAPTEESVTSTNTMPTEVNIANATSANTIPTEDNVAYATSANMIPTEDNVAYANMIPTEDIAAYAIVTVSTINHNL